jgi:hypothetical protein
MLKNAGAWSCRTVELKVDTGTGSTPKIMATYRSRNGHKGYQMAWRRRFLPRPASISAPLSDKGNRSGDGSDACDFHIQPSDVVDLVDHGPPPEDRDVIFREEDSGVIK